MTLSHTTSAPRFSLRFLRGAAPFVYEYQPWLEGVQRLDPSDTITAIDERDVESYEVYGSPSPCIDLRLTPTAAGRLVALERSLMEVPVIVTLDGTLLYAGREYLRYGAAALRFPVVQRDRLGERVLRVCASLMPGGEIEARRIDRPELRELFRALGRFRERSR